MLTRIETELAGLASEVKRGRLALRLLSERIPELSPKKLSLELKALGYSTVKGKANKAYILIVEDGLASKKVSVAEVSVEGAGLASGLALEKVSVEHSVPGVSIKGLASEPSPITVAVPNVTVKSKSYRGFFPRSRHLAVDLDWSDFLQEQGFTRNKLNKDMPPDVMAKVHGLLRDARLGYYNLRNVEAAEIAYNEAKALVLSSISQL